jgi:nitrite reductase (NADH) small subunit
MNQTRRWTQITNRENIPLREGRCVKVGDREIAIFNLGDRFLSIDNRCPHSGGPLCDGIVSGTSVVCPLHGWKVNLETGETMRPSDAGRCVETFPTRVDSGVVVVELPCRAESDDFNANDATVEVVGEVDGQYHRSCACAD